MSYLYECNECKSLFVSEIPQSYAVEICDDCLTVDIVIDKEYHSTSNCGVQNINLPPSAIQSFMIRLTNKSLKWNGNTKK
jgi:hypothetical protein